MRKLIILALIALGTSTAFAGDSDALKAIMKAKSYAEAESLLKNSLSQLAGNEEKAKAYNKLVDLAMADFNKILQVELSNENMKQTGNSANVQPYDTVALYNSLDNAYTAAAECDKYDQMPNEKGKIKSKYRTSNSARLFPIRYQLINGGIYYQGKGDDKNAYKFLANYVETAELPLFTGVDNSADSNISNIAYYATIYAFQAGDFKKAEKYVEIAAKDPEKGKEASNMRLGIMQAQLKSHADSLNYIDKLKALYAQEPSNDVVLGTLADMYSAMKNEAELEKMISGVLSSNPNNTMALMIKGRSDMYKDKYDEAIASFKKAVEIKQDNPQLYTYLGFCLNNKAQIARDRVARNGKALSAAEEQIKNVYKESITYLEKAKELDPGREKANWAYPLYQAYYMVYGADDAKTKEAEALTKR